MTVAQRDYLRKHGIDPGRLEWLPGEIVTLPDGRLLLPNGVSVLPRHQAASDEPRCDRCGHDRATHVRARRRSWDPRIDNGPDPFPNVCASYAASDEGER